MTKFIASKDALSKCVIGRESLPVVVLGEDKMEYDYLSLGPVTRVDINLGPYYIVYVGDKAYTVWCV